MRINLLKAFGHACLLLLATTVSPLATAQPTHRTTTRPVSRNIPAVPLLHKSRSTHGAGSAATASGAVKSKAKPSTAKPKARAATKHTSAATSVTRHAAKATSASQDLEWWFRPHKDHTPSGGPTNVKVALHRLHYLGDTSRKVIYLTFDEGSEFGYTKHILDVLKANGVHATFFLTRFYMKEAPDLVKRIVAEGHTVGNHSATHPEHLGRLPDQRIKDEILLTAQYYKNLTGQDMAPLFRPPCGDCSERVLSLIDSLGWRAVFWSMAYGDYEPKMQKGAKYAVERVMKYYHPGMIILLHPFASNSEGLDTMIKDLKAAGYTFGTVMDIPAPTPLIAAAPGAKPVLTAGAQTGTSATLTMPHMEMKTGTSATLAMLNAEMKSLLAQMKDNPLVKTVSSRLK